MAPAGNPPGAIGFVWEDAALQLGHSPGLQSDRPKGRCAAKEAGAK
jgi:hypothetical protein